MKIKITEKTIIQEIKATEDFRFDKQFVESLRKPGKTTMIRFSDATSGDDVLLTPNISKYAYSHTPAAIYGYPLHNQEVLTLLRNQELQFNNFPIIIVYWVDDTNIVDLNKISKEECKDLVDQIILIKGKESVLAALKKWESREQERANWRRYGNAYDSLPSQLLRNDINIDNLMYVKDKYGEIFWNILREIGTSTEKTALLLKLTLKQKDQEGNLVEKKFNTILDTDATIDIRHPVKGTSQAPVQALTLTSAGLGGYKFYNNPSAIVTRRYKKYGQKPPDKTKIGSENIRRFDQSMSSYLSQMSGVRKNIEKNIKFTPTSEGYSIRLKMPAPSGGTKIEKSIVKRITAAKQKLNIKPPVTEDEISKKIAFQVVSGWMASLDGQLHEPTRVKILNDFRDQKSMIVTPDGDYFEFNINLRDDTYDVIAPTRVYGFLYFLFDLYNKQSDWNPFLDWRKYEELAKIATQFIK